MGMAVADGGMECVDVGCGEATVLVQTSLDKLLNGQTGTVHCQKR